MKKILLIIAMFVLVYTVINHKKDYYVIPDESIRFRVIASSNNVYDQYIKNKVKEKLEKEFSTDLLASNSINDSRKTILKNIDNYKKIVASVLEEENYSLDYNVNYGLNYFPKKEYKGVIYEAGDYESLVVTLGKGEGNNFWCVLFPPICSLEVEEGQEIEYRFMVKDLFNKYILNKANN